MRLILKLFIILLIPNITLAHNFYNAKHTRVIDVKASSYDNGSDVILYTPFGTQNQNIIYEHGQLKPAANFSFCLDVSRNRNYKYNQVILWKCNGGDNQKFTISNGFIYPKDKPTQCLTYSDNGTIKAEECKRAENQKFYVPKVCIYKDAYFKGEVRCINENKEQLELNDTASSVTVINAVARLYEHASYKGRSRVINRNINWLGDADNDKFSSLEIPNERTFLITSDPQLVCSTNCGVNAGTSKNNIRQQYQFLSQKYPDAEAVIINGDQTEYGHKDEWEQFENLASYIKGIPFYYGLGNHDIFNNLNNCYENNCTIRSIRKLKDHVRVKGNLYSFDMHYTRGYHFPEERDTFKGSFSYSLDFGDVVVIQLNDYEKKHNPLKISQYSSLLDSLGGNGARRYVIDRYQDAEYAWLRNQLEQADIKNQFVILNQHRHDADAGKLKELIKKHNVKLLFSGHYHYNVQKNSNGFFSSGSSARGDYLRLTIDTKKRTAAVYKYKKGSTQSGQEELMEKFSIANKTGPGRLMTAPLRVKVKNSGAYISFVDLRWIDYNGKYRYASSGDLLAGNVFDYTIPAGGTLDRVVSKNYTGLVWEHTKTIFDLYDRPSDVCINTWGTTLSPSWEFVACY